MLRATCSVQTMAGVQVKIANIDIAQLDVALQLAQNEGEVAAGAS